MKRVALTASLVVALVALCSLVIGNWSAGVGRSARAENVAGVSAIKGLTGCATSSLEANDDLSSEPVPLPFTLDFFGQNYTSLYVNNNGNVTFNGSLSTYTPFGLLGTDSVIIAPFFADVDTRGIGSGLTTYGTTTFGGRPAFCVNWLNVGYFSSQTNKKNSFQLLIVDRSDVGPGDFDILFNYDQIQWEAGSASGGVDGLGGNSARAGYSNGADSAFELPGSAVNGAFLDSSPSGLSHNNRGSVIPGRYLFNVRNGEVPLGGFVSGRVLGQNQKGLNEPMASAPVQICRQDVVPAVCSATTTNANGDYNVAGLTAGTYNGVAGPPASRPDLFADVNELFQLSNNQGVIDYDFKLLRPRPIPPGITVQSIGNTSTGAPVINWARPVQVTKFNDNCQGGGGTFELIKEGQVIASGIMAATATPGLFKGTLPALRPQHGPAVLHIEVSCPGAGEDKDVEVDVYIDPSGVVKTTGGAPIPGATVTLYRSDSSAGPFDVVPDGSAVMSPSNRTNPDMTDAEGFFHWDVIAGYYKVRAQKQGCHAPGNAAQAFVETSVLTIPPPALNLELTLECPGGGGPTATRTPTRTPTQPGAQPTATRTRTRTPTLVTPGGLNGDVNCNGNRDSIDATLVLQYGAGLLPTLQCLNLADVNHDGSVNSIDATVILQYVAGLLRVL